MHFSRIYRIYDQLDDDDNSGVAERTMVEHIKRAMNDYFWEEKLTGVEPEWKVEEHGWQAKVKDDALDLLCTDK